MGGIIFLTFSISILHFLLSILFENVLYSDDCIQTHILNLFESKDLKDLNKFRAIWYPYISIPIFVYLGLRKLYRLLPKVTIEVNGQALKPFRKVKLAFKKMVRFLSQPVFNDN